MKFARNLLFIIAPILCLPAFSLADDSTSAANGLAVIGVVNELKGEEWQDYRIGFGVRQLISQSLYNTARFTLLEEKTEIKEKIAEINQRMWLFGEEKSKISDELENAKELQTKYVAYGRIYYFGRPQTDVNVGVLHSRTTDTIIKIEVVIQNMDTGKSISAKGTGKASTQASSMLFSIRENNVLFDETSVGTATKEAIEEAVLDVMKKFHKIQ